MIQTRALTRRFGSFVAVSDVSIEVAAGAILALLGPNGAGKTTTVRMLAALLAPSSGTAQVAGYDVSRDPTSVRASVGLVTDAPGLYEQMPVTDYLNLFGTIYGLQAPHRQRRVQELISFFELEPYRSQRMAGFSKGMKQKVALARALIDEPPVLFLDEPTAGLDPLAARAVRELILALKQDRRTIILCTHDLDEAERLADRVAIMRRGQIIALDSPAALRAQAAARSVRIELAQPAPSAVAALQGIAGAANLRLLDRNGGASTPALASLAPLAAASRTDPAPDPQPVWLAYETHDPQLVNPQVVAQLVALGAQIVAVTNEAPSLEDIYATLMEDAQTGASEGEPAVHQAVPHRGTGDGNDER